MLATLVALLAAAAIAVPLSRHAGFGSVLGYLVAGIAIGPSGLRLVTGVDQIAEIAELGVIMLLFLIGLEVRPARLWVMRRAVFGLGSAQVGLSALALAILAHAAGLPWAAAAVLGAGLAMSSTAIVLPMLGERELLASRAGRDGFAVLLFQDLAFIPLVALVPLLGGGAALGDNVWRHVALAAAAVALILLLGRFAIRPAFRALGAVRTPEIFTIFALLTVVGTAFLANAAGLSPSLGAFMAGVLLSESEYRHELQADIEPFEGVLLGFFFISVGMSARLGLLLAHPGMIAAGLAAVLAAKIAVAYALARLARQGGVDATRFALALQQGSEFSFVLFAAAVAAGALGQDAADMATLVVALSMVATPLLFAASERALVPRLRRQAAPRYDTIDAADAPVILCGFGRVGQIIGRILRMQGIAFTALERDPGQIEVVRRFGTKVYFGDPTRPDLLRAAGAETARLLIVATDNMEEALRVVDIARRNFPGLAIVSRARNRRHVHLLMDRGVQGIVRDTFHSSLKLSELSLQALGIAPERARRTVDLFAEHDEANLASTHAIYRDETQLRQSVQQATDELAALFDADQSGEDAVKSRENR
ncbi:MAG: monovalent cation:proton antiporter-2 (CPA2) family protein [Rhodospirillales bacterium]|nr:monovalent cation:proton antiporter-2 (CPA2) family protein [Rhodospirillales bacterium]MDE2573700.1 monovalent cation:proton antiporter-2 (CPA2) family protein [Rhodospirillales bacterium]